MPTAVQQPTPRWTIATSADPTIVRVWSGPRNISTALMRSWENRVDTRVQDEPLYASFLARTGQDHPGAADVIAAGPAGYDDAVQHCVQPTLGSGERISYQKQMAHHLLPGDDLGWIGGTINVLLVRHPRRVIASYLRIRQRPTLQDLGFPQLTMLAERFGPLPVIEADRFLADPETHLRALCAVAGVRFDTAMLQWPAGARSSDGVWAPHWYGAVDRSTGFGAASTDTPEQIDLPPSLDSVVRQATSLYCTLAAQAM